MSKAKPETRPDPRPAAAAATRRHQGGGAPYYPLDARRFHELAIELEMMLKNAIDTGPKPPELTAGLEGDSFNVMAAFEGDRDSVQAMLEMLAEVVGFAETVLDFCQTLAVRKRFEKKLAAMGGADELAK